MLLLITVVCVIAEKKLQLNSASLYVVVIFIIGGILIGGGAGPLPPLATPMGPHLAFLWTYSNALIRVDLPQYGAVPARGPALKS